MSLNTRKPQSEYMGTALAFACIFGVILYFCLLMPKASDDFAFHANMSSYSDVFQLAWNNYLSWDGRSIGFLINHTLIFLPTLAASAAMASFFCFLIFLMHLYLHAHEWRERLGATSILGLAALLWSSIPALGAVIFWKTGFGYCVTAAWMILFLLPFRFTFDPNNTPESMGNPSLVAIFGFMLFAFYAGLHDYSIPLLYALLALGIFCYCQFWQHSHKKIRKLYLAGGVGILLGNMAAVLAPGNFGRLSVNPDFVAFANLSFFEKILRYLANLDYIHSWFLIPYIILTWSLYVFCKKYGRTFWRHLPFWGCIPFLVAQISMGAFILAPVSPRRAFTSISILLVLSACILMKQALPHAGKAPLKVLRACKIVLFAYCLLSIPYEMKVFADASKISEQRLALLQQDRSNLCLPSYALAEDRFLPIGDNNDIHDLTEDPEFWLNKDLRRIWKKESVTRCPAAERIFGTSAGSTLVTATLQGKIMRVETTVPVQDEGKKITLYYPAKMHDVLNPNPLYSWLQETLLGGTWLRDILVPVFYKSQTVTLTSAEPQKYLSWEHVQPQKMHFFVRQGKGSALTFFEEKRETAQTQSNEGRK